MIVPQAFDQPFNARLLDRSGLGFDTTRTRLVEALEHALYDRALTAKVEAFAAQLVPPGVAAREAAASILSAAGG